MRNLLIKRHNPGQIQNMILCFGLLLAFSLAFTGCGVGASGSSKVSEADLTAQRSIVAESLNGYVEATKDRDSYRLAQGEKLTTGMSVKTATESDLTMILDSDKHVYAASETRFGLIAWGREGSTRTRLELQSGTLVCGIDNKLGSDETFTVTTPNASMAVRGTVFTTKVINKGHGEYETVLSVDQGSIETTTIEDGKEKKVTVGAGETGEFTGTAPEIKEEPEETAIRERKAAEAEASFSGSEEAQDIHKITDVNKRFEIYRSGKLGIERYMDVDTPSPFVILKGTAYRFEDYFVEEMREVSSRGQGLGYTEEVFVLSEPFTAPDGSIVKYMITGGDFEGFCNKFDDLPMGREVEVAGFLYTLSFKPADSSDWVDLDYEIYGAKAWSLTVFDYR